MSGNVFTPEIVKPVIVLRNSGPNVSVLIWKSLEAHFIFMGKRDDMAHIMF